MTPTANDLDDDRLVFRTQSNGRIHLIEHFENCRNGPSIGGVKRVTVKSVFDDDPVCQDCWSQEHQHATRVNKRITNFVIV